MGEGSLEELRKKAGLPVFVTQFSNPDVLKDIRLRAYCRGQRLVVPETELSAVMKIVTGDYGLYDCQVRKADLSMIFARFVLNLSVEELA